jgi:hypothetical protein
VKQSNKKKSEQYERECREQKEALKGLWDDWEACCSTDYDMRRVVTTFNDYVKTAGDAQTASRFLAKVFSHSKIAEAAEWCGVEIPDPRTSEAESAPAPMPREPQPADDISF